MRAGQASFLADNLQIFIEDLLCTHSVLRSVGHIERFCVRQDVCVFTEKTRMAHVNKGTLWTPEYYFYCLDLWKV